MNYLAHLYLSGEDQEVALGNFIGDGVKGRIGNRYPRMIRVGLHLHRFIDETADTHPVNLQSRSDLYPHFGKYAGVVQDMLHDHFLARNWDRYSDLSLPEFLARFYALADERHALFPARQLRFYTAMKQGDWLINYAELDGMSRSFNGLSQRAVRGGDIRKAGPYLEAHYEELEEAFFSFFPLLQKAVKSELERLLTTL